MKRKLLLLLAVACLLSCRKNDLPAQSTRPDGTAGVSVDAQGNLVINAPVYVAIPEGNEKYELKPADGDLFLEIDDSFSVGEIDKIIIASGTISGGRVSITIPIPDSKSMRTAESRFSSERLKSGSDIRCRFIRISGADVNLGLFANPQVEYDSFGEEWYDFIYSEGDVVVSGSYIGSAGDGYAFHELVDVRLTQGWNTIAYSDKVDSEAKTVTRTEISKNPPPDAVWVLWWWR